MTNTCTTTLHFGKLKLEVTRHEWDCGDGCCSSSGWTAEIGDFNYGDVDRDGHLDQDAFVEAAVDAYFADRDYKIEERMRQSLSNSDKTAREQSNSVFNLMAVLYCHLDNITANDAFAKTKRAQLLKTQTPLLLRGIFEKSPHQILLASCGDYQPQINEIIAEQVNRLD